MSVRTAFSAVSTNLSRTILRLVLLALLIDFTHAFNFTFLTIPAQCEELSIAISGGVPPYRLLIVPVGELLTPPEIRTIIDRNITGTTHSFTFNYPAASQFIAMMGDATGIGTGGTSAIIAVGGSGTKSECLQSSVSAPKFYLYLDPETPSQCQTTNVSWGPGYQGQVHVWNLVVGGQSSALTIPSGATSVQWTANIRTNTTILFVAGDETGAGTGGSSSLLTIGAGSDSCINANSPSSTQRPPAGGINTAGGVSTPTATSSLGGSGNIGAIVGGVIGGVAGLVIILLVLLFFYRRRKHHRNSGTRPMKPDLIDPSEDRPAREEGPGLYEPEPFIMPEPTNAETSSRHSLYSAHDGAPPRTSMTTASGAPGAPARAPSRLSVTTMSELGGVPPSSHGTRKTGMPPTSFRPVNFIQHDDAGEVDPNSQAPETIELPPAYTDFRSKAPEPSGSGAGASPTAAEESTPTPTPAETTPVPAATTPAPASTSGAGAS